MEGNNIDVYVRLGNISNPVYAYFTWATDNADPNFDSSPNIDRSNAYHNTDLSKADISINKSDNIDLVYPGNSFVYTINIINHGPHDASNVNVTDVLPTEVTYLSATPSPTHINYPLYTWIFSSMAVGDKINITMNVVLNDNVSPGVIINSVYAYNDTYDPLLGNNVDIEHTTVGISSDLGIKKSDSTDFVYPGDSFTYKLQVTNFGPHDAADVVVKDILPVGVIFNSSVPPSSSNSGSIFFWNISSISVGETIEILVNVTTDNVKSGTIINFAEVSSSGADLVPENNVASENTSIGNAVDIEISKSDNIDPTYPEQTITYTLNVTNNGPGTALNVNVTDILPKEVSFVNSTPAPSGNNGSVYYWNFASLLAGDSEVILIEVSIDSLIEGNITNVAEAVSDTYELSSENNVASESTTIKHAADLSIAKSGSADQLFKGDNLTYFINVTNNGPNTAENVVIADLLPSEITLVNLSLIHI